MRIFQWLRRRKATINGVLITIFTSLFFNTISNSSEAFFNNPGSVLKEIFLLNSLSGILTWLSIGLLVFINAVYFIMHKLILKKSLRDDFIEIMKKNTSESLKDSVRSGCLSWGEGKNSSIL